MKSKFRVVIIGGGLSGLSAAHTLLDRGCRDFVLLERNAVPGGRVRTVEKDGFRLDLGFQVGLSSYPAFRRILPLRLLEPRFFGAGALVEEQPGEIRCLAHPLRHPSKISNGIFSKLPLADRARLVKQAVECIFRDDQSLLEPTGQTALTWLKQKGFTDAMIDSFFRPFFGGVFLDNELETDASLLRYYLKKFIIGRAFVPRGGMGEMSQRLADEIPIGKIRYRTEVGTITHTDDGVLISLEEGGERITAGKVIIATDPGALAKLSGWGDPPEFRPTKVIYYRSDERLYQGPWIVLPSKGNGIVQHFVQMTNVDPSLAPKGQSLLSATVLDDRGLDDEMLAAEVKKDIARLFPEAETLLETLCIIPVPAALPVQDPEAISGYRQHTFGEGIFPAGDLVSNASLQNALQSGRDAALKVLDRY
ncbi:MAG: NAD(P)/FAD-dependent oxidoreductase [Verrucomicrobiales bacterium]|nr:NAD(P)/FAD-dependent oxidoreductase [Verrucomicrobiales bacterium]